MKVAIVHYHLEPGGVTRVIENTLLGWKEAGTEIETVVLSGRSYSGSVIPKVEFVQGLDYTTPEISPKPELLIEAMEIAAARALGGKPDIWHVHNHSLGKNPSLPLALSILARKGAYMLLHPHDFAEDGRPSNFKALNNSYFETYPSSERIHYAALNHRDFSYLSEMLTGFSSKAHLLANAISNHNKIEPEKTHQSLPEELFLYPVRAVRRKNLGELALLSLLHPEKHFANSLGPTNPNFNSEFEGWKQFAQGLNLNLTYALGENCTASFPEMVAHAKAIVSTSVAEGFGLGFLEPWIFGKGLCGRDIPEITSDFSKLGIQLNHLYERSEVSLDLLENPQSLKDSITLSLKAIYDCYGMEMPQNAIEEAFRSIVSDGLLDFGRLNEGFQKEILLNLRESPEQLEQIRRRIPLEVPTYDEIIRNQKAIQIRFSQKEYGKKLYNIYKEILANEDHRLDFAQGKKLLNAFLSPQRLNLLRTD